MPRDDAHKTITIGTPVYKRLNAKRERRRKALGMTALSWTGFLELVDKDLGKRKEKGRLKR